MNKNFKSFLTLVVIVFIGIWVTIMLIGLFTTKIDGGGSLECETGYIGLNIDTINDIQNYTCPNNNFTCYKENLLLQSIKLNGIGALSCKGSYQGSLPSFLITFLEGII